MAKATTRLAWSMLTRDPHRLLGSLVGVAFSTLALFVCVGFFNGMNDSQARVATALKGDLVIFGRRTQSVNSFDGISSRNLYRLLTLQTIAEIIPINQGALDVKNPDTGMCKSIQFFAFPPDSDPFDLPGFAENLPKLKEPGTIVYDSTSRESFGKIESGMDVEVNGVSVRVVGTVPYGPNFSRHGSIFMSDATLNERLGEHRVEMVSMGLVKAKKGVDIGLLKATLLSKLPEEFEVTTPDELHTRELLHNLRSTPIGALLAIGMLVALFVGSVVAYQILYTEVSDHLSQFATLKAIGFSKKFLGGVVIKEALFLSVLGFLPGAVAARAVYSYIQLSSGMCMVLSGPRVAAGFTLTVAMCVAAGRIALDRAVEADPAELF